MQSRLPQSFSTSPTGKHAAFPRRLHTLVYDSLLLFIRNPQPMWILDPATLGFLRVNRAALKHYGYTKREFKLLTARDIRPPEEVPAFCEFIRQMIAGGKPITHSWRHVTRANRIIYVECTYQMIQIQDRQGILVLIQDVSERRHFEQAFIEADRRYRSIFDNAVEGIYQNVPEGKFLNVNPAFSRMLGYDSPEEFCEIVQDAARDMYVRSELRALYKKQLESNNILKGLEFEVYRKDRSKIWISVNVRVVRDSSGSVLYYEGTAEDITSRKLAEERMQTLNSDLERKAQELARSNSELQQFAYAASHDLQEPLRMISSYLDLVSKRYKGRLDRDADEFIHFAVDGAKRMKGLIDDLLAYSRVGRSEDMRGVYDCNGIVRQALQNLDLSMRESNAKVECKNLPEVFGSGPQLILLFQNLLGNAVKFKGPQPLVICVSAKQSGLEWLFEVRDNGIGIDMQYSERIFRIFQRLHGREVYPGTGMGLAICKKVVESHGGRIWVEAAPGRGSSFFFTLPLSLPNV
jgi:PAS domain S-box-containing protein